MFTLKDKKKWAPPALLSEDLSSPNIKRALLLGRSRMQRSKCGIEIVEWQGCLPVVVYEAWSEAFINDWLIQQYDRPIWEDHRQPEPRSWTIHDRIPRRILLMSLPNNLTDVYIEPDLKFVVRIGWFRVVFRLCFIRGRLPLRISYREF